MARADFGLIREIDPARPRTWRGRIFLTFDMDYAADDVLRETIDVVRASGRAATWFVTHETPVLAELRREQRFELGVHPNIERLLWRPPDPGQETAPQVMAAIRGVVPEATSVRCHFLTRSSALSQLFFDLGYRHECSTLLPVWSNIAPRPFVHPAGHLEVPFGWEDDVAISAGGLRSVERYVRPDALNVFNFHPVHVAANTATRAQLNRAISVLRRPLVEVRAGVRPSRRPPGRRGARQELEALLGVR